MAPMYDFECLECGKVWETLIRGEADLNGLECPTSDCRSANWHRCFPKDVAYAPIKNNGASVRPKRAGSKR